MSISPIVEERFEHKGFLCVVLFQSMGFRTGYVGIPKGHKCYGQHYDRIDVSCHCGLTYSSTSLINQNDEDIWWIGFDCGHCCDANDYAKAKEYFADNQPVMESLLRLEELNNIYDTGGEIRTFEYVKEQCKYIVEQLLEREGPKCTLSKQNS